MAETQPVHNDDSIFRRERTGILIHGYWPSEKGKGTDLGLRSGINTRAGIVEYHDRKSRGEETALFVNLAHMWGQDEPTEGSLMAQRLEKRYHVPKEDIVLREDAWSTWGEVKTLAEEARRRGWTRIVDVAFRPHHLTIPWIFGKFGIKPQYETPEHILRTKDIHRFERTYKTVKPLNMDRNGNEKPWKEVPITERQYEETGNTKIVSHEHNHTKRLVRRLTWSKFGGMYWVYEIGKRIKMLKPGFNYEDLETANRESRSGKGTDSPLSKRFGRRVDFDVYTLNGVPSPFSRKLLRKTS